MQAYLTTDLKWTPVVQVQSLPIAENLARKLSPKESMNSYPTPHLPPAPLANLE